MKNLLVPFIVLPLLSSTSLATAPMSPGAGKSLVQAWEQSDVGQNHKHAATQSAAIAEQDRRPYVLNEVVVVEFSSDESEVKQRARRAVQSVNSRQWEQRLGTEAAVHQGSYLEKAGWVSREGKLNARKLPWWIW